MACATIMQGCSSDLAENFVQFYIAFFVRQGTP